MAWSAAPTAGHPIRDGRQDCRIDAIVPEIAWHSSPRASTRPVHQRAGVELALFLASPAHRDPHMMSAYQDSLATGPSARRTTGGSPAKARAIW